MKYLLPLLAALLPAGAPADDRLGLFEGQADVGTLKQPGTLAFDKDAGTYTISSGGANMWGARDAFHYLYRKAEGDLSLSADVAFEGEGVDPHRKACLVIRQDLEADSAYVDIALHGDGLTSLQFRETKGGDTHEIRANVTAPRRLRIEKRGNYVTMHLGSGDDAPTYAGAALRIELREPFYVGLGVCAHNDDAIETVVFSNVEYASPPPAASGRPELFSVLETMDMASGNRQVVRVFASRIEAPNWLRDGKTLLYNSGGRLYTIPAAGGEPEVLDTGFATRCNNDHGLSPDGTRLAISDQTRGGKSLIYTLPVEGGTPRPITPVGPSYWHGWSPDGKTLAYCAERAGEFDVYTIPAAGGPETRLTTAKGLDDGPEYSPDGAWIYFNSDRTGTMHLYRMRPDGADQVALTDDEFNNWFPHPSPDGESLVFLTFAPDVEGHPADKDVTLRRMTLPDRKIDVLARLYGGQGTINVPCWSPDGRSIAFVSYMRFGAAAE